MLKALTGELVNEVVQTCQQFHGGMGYIRETAVERLWRDARVLAIGGGATEVMLEEVARVAASPLKGATPAVRQSRSRGVRWVKTSPLLTVESS
jgi:hypothetical protein